MQAKKNIDMQHKGKQHQEYVIGLESSSLTFSVVLMKWKPTIVDRTDA